VKKVRMEAMKYLRNHQHLIKARIFSMSNSYGMTKYALVRGSHSTLFASRVSPLPYRVRGRLGARANKSSTLNTFMSTVLDRMKECTGPTDTVITLSTSPQYSFL
jgi:hypothetical protein